MSERIQKQDIAALLAKRMGTDITIASRWLEAVTDILFQEIRSGKSVTLRNFGSFYVRPERSTWVFKFNPSQKLGAALNWSSASKGRR